MWDPKKKNLYIYKAKRKKKYFEGNNERILLTEPFSKYTGWSNPQCPLRYHILRFYRNEQCVLNFSPGKNKREKKNQWWNKRIIHFIGSSKISRWKIGRRRRGAKRTDANKKKKTDCNYHGKKNSMSHWKEKKNWGNSK